MLSYRHSYHAGNFADVLKHIVLVEILQHLGRKTKGFDYIDTHAGAGLYNLQSAASTKLAEHEAGIGKLWAGDWPALAEYFAAIAHYNGEGLRCYPGSPMIAKTFLRPQDKAWLYELHSSDVALLHENVSDNKQLRVHHSDGFAGLQSLLPPMSRRALVLIDPSYEVKSDYDKVFEAVAAAHRKFATGIYAIWYPVVERGRIDQLQRQFIASGIRDIQQYELGLRADTDAMGMTASGMIVVNPPWQLAASMNSLLPQLAAALSAGEGQYRSEVLVPE